MDFLLIILYCAFPFVIWRLMVASRVRFSKITIPSILIIAMFLITYIGILPLYLGWDRYRYAAGVQDKVLIFKLFVHACESILGLALGFCVAKYFTRKSLFESHKEAFMPLKLMQKYFLMVFFLFCIAITYLYLTKIPKLAIAVVIKDGLQAAQKARSQMGNNFPGKYHWYMLFMHHVLYFLVWSLLANWLLTKKKIDFLLFFCAFPFAVFTSIMATEKAPLCGLIVGCILTYLITLKKGHFKVLFCMGALALLSIILAVFYQNFMGTVTFSKSILSAMSRFFCGELHTAYYYLDFFPKHHDFLMGRSFPNPRGWIPFEPYNIPINLKNHYFPDLTHSGIVGSAPTVFWGEIYANFGPAFIFIGSLLVGIYIYLISHFVNKLANTPIKAGLLAWLALHYATLTVTGIASFIFDFYLFITVGIALFLIFVGYKGNSQQTT